MRSMVYVRPAKSEDAAQFLEWQTSKEFDPAAPLYPDSFTLCAFDDNGVLAYMPVQQPVFDRTFVLESVCFRPNASELEKATAMKQFVQTCVFLGYTNNAKELYFVGTNPDTNSFAEKYFEKLPWPVYRMRLNNQCQESTHE